MLASFNVSSSLGCEHSFPVGVFPPEAHSLSTSAPFYSSRTGQTTQNPGVVYFLDFPRQRGDTAPWVESHAQSV
jgi:hypothetical protein